MPIVFKSNMVAVVNQIDAKMSAIDIDRMTRLQATSLLGVMRVRIHQDGLDSQGTPIGIYTPSYIKYARAKAKRGTDPKVVLSLTRSMENSMELYPITNGTGIGFSTKENWQKAKWCEETYGKKIFAPTTQEREMVVAIGKDFIQKHFE